MGQPVSFASDLQPQLALLLPRLKCFAAALTGSAAATHVLVKATVRSVATTAAKERGHVALATFAYGRMHTLWSRHEQTRAASGEPPVRADPALFHTDREPSLATSIADMPPQQRATLALVYGDGMSYDEVAEVFGVRVGVVMTRLSRGHAAIAGLNRAERPEPARSAQSTLHAERRENAA